MAHGSDLLAQAVAHPHFESESAGGVLATVHDVLERVQRPFCDDEEERIANVLVVGMRSGAIAEERVVGFIEATDAEFWQANADDDSLASYYRLSAWKRVVQTLYFLAPAVRPACQSALKHYYHENGY